MEKPSQASVNCNHTASIRGPGESRRVHNQGDDGPPKVARTGASRHSHVHEEACRL